MDWSPLEIARQALARNHRRSVEDPSLIPAGVTCLLFRKDDEYCVLLNKRSQQVEHHKGEISFPGGMKDPGDATLLDTALREAFEEMGILPSDVEILGEVDDVPTNSRFLIRPFIGTIPYPYDFKPSSAEVAAVLEVPLFALMNRANRRDEIRIKNGKLVNAPTFAYEGNLIYGATARVLDNFLSLIETALEKEA
jgi:8-oxo-dGTP pyrophosphatase MutT (NUDIX family)